MKKFVFLLSLVAGIAFGQVPEMIPFSKGSITKAFADADRIAFKVYSGNGKTAIHQQSFDLPLLNGEEHFKAELKKLGSMGYSVPEPDKQVRVSANVLDSSGTPVMEAYQSFKLVKEGGKYRPPTYDKFWFQVNDRKIFVKGAKSAKVTDRNGVSIPLNVTNGVITVNSYVASNDFWETLSVKFEDGSTIRYEGVSGKRIRPALVSQEIEADGVADLAVVEIDDGVVNFHFQPQYGWNPTLEVTNDSKGLVTLDTGIWIWDEYSGDEFLAARPTRVYVTTVEDARNGKAPVEYDFSPEESSFDTLDITLDVGTYHIWFDWMPHRYTQDYTGGKG